MSSTVTPPPVHNDVDSSVIITAVVIPIVGIVALSIGLSYKRYLVKKRRGRENLEKKENEETPNTAPVQNATGTLERVPNGIEIRDVEMIEVRAPGESINSRNIELPPRPVDTDVYVEMRDENRDIQSHESGDYETISNEFDEYENRKLRKEEQNREGIYSIESMDVSQGGSLTHNPEDWAAPHDPDNLPEIIE